MRYRWKILAPDSESVDRLVEELKIAPLLARLLVNRGITDPDAGDAFLNPDLSRLHDPFLMRDMERAVSRLEAAVEKGEKILIYGDYDVDGITSTAIVRRALEMLGGKVEYHIPHRLDDGYGLKESVLEEAAARGVRVVVSVDSGIRAVDAAATARRSGIDLIITDHHLPGDRLPEAFAILNPRRPDCDYPDSDLAGVGVAFKLVDGLFRRADKSRATPHFLKMVAIGTIADMVPLRGENRVMVHFGLKALGEPYNLGLQALLQGAGVGPTVTHADIGFKVAPRLNAYTRMGGGGEIVELFALNDPARATALVQEMNDRNLRRRQEEDDILSLVEEQQLEDPCRFEGHFLVVSGRGWHRGVIGNVASRLVERFHRPVLVMSVDADRCQGSGRSIPGFHFLDALDGCSDLFAAYGGHSQAAGCTLTAGAGAEDIEQLRKRLEEHAVRVLEPGALEPTLQIDAQLEADEITLELASELERLAPHGIGNRSPLFASRELRLEGGPWILKEKHLKLRAAAGGGPVDAIWWRHADRVEQINGSESLDLAYQLKRDTFRGQQKLLLTVRDLRRPETAPAPGPTDSPEELSETSVL